MGSSQIKFPCGLEINADFFGHRLEKIEGDGILAWIIKNGCLIHGKSCNSLNTSNGGGGGSHGN